MHHIQTSVITTLLFSELLRSENVNSDADGVQENYLEHAIFLRLTICAGAKENQQLW